MNKEFLNILPNSNYSSFIQHPFKVVFSGALPTQSRSNNVVLRPERNRAEWATGNRRSVTGRPFQAVGPATEKARRCRVTVRVQGTSNSACAEKRNEIRCLIATVGQQCSRRKGDAKPSVQCLTNAATW